MEFEWVPDCQNSPPVWEKTFPKSSSGMDDRGDSMIKSTMQVKKHIQSKIAKSDSPCENQLAWRRTGLCISLVQSTMNNLLLCLHTGEMHLDKDMEDVTEIKASPDYNHEHRGFHHLWVSLSISNLRELPPWYPKYRSILVSRHWEFLEDPRIGETRHEICVFFCDLKPW